MKKGVTCFAGCVALALLAFAPSKASAGWGWWGGLARKKLLLWVNSGPKQCSSRGPLSATGGHLP